MKDACYFCGSTKIYTVIPINESSEKEDSYPKAPVCRKCYCEQCPEEAEIWEDEITNGRVHGE